VLRALAERPGHVISRRELMGHLPSGQAGSEHAVEVAVARLRSAVGSRLVQTVVKRGYRLPVT
jgi:uroporphyrinogen-III synthase